MAHTEKNIFTLRNNLTVFLGHQKTIISAVWVQEIPIVAAQCIYGAAYMELEKVRASLEQDGLKLEKVRT